MNKDNIHLSTSLLLYVCVECGLVQKDNLYTKDFYDRYKNPNIVKTYIPYQYKYRNICRLNKWGNYSYHEVQEDKLLKEIDMKLVNFDRDITNFSKVLFTQLYRGLSIRAKIKDSLVVYCLFRTLLYLNRPVEIDDLLKLFNISIKNYLDLNNKLKDSKLLYLKEMNTYIELADNKIKKNDLIKIYSKFIEYNKRKFNNKSILLGIIYTQLSKEEDFDIKDFYHTFLISKTSIKNVSNFIKTHKII